MAENGIVLWEFRIAKINIEYVFTTNEVRILTQKEHFHLGHYGVIFADLYAVKLSAFFPDCGFGQKYTLAAADIHYGRGFGRGENRCGEFLDIPACVRPADFIIPIPVGAHKIRHVDVIDGVQCFSNSLRVFFSGKQIAEDECENVPMFRTHCGI